MRIENVTTKDAKEILDIYSYYVSNTAISLETKVPTLEEFSERIEKISSKFPYIKAVTNENEILGYAYANTFKERGAYNWTCEVTIYVRKDKRGNGIGKALYAKLEELVKEMGIENMVSVIAYPEIPDSYLTWDSKIFHEKMGFTVAGRYHKCANKFGNWYDMITMEKLIGKHEEEVSEVKFMDKYFAYCGLDCKKCEAYIATQNDDNELRKKVAKEWSEMNQIEILPEWINCDGCRLDGRKTVFCDQLCEIRKCAINGNYETCGNCDILKNCEKIKMIIDHNEEAKKRLEK